MCDDAAEKELREEYERMSDVELLAVVVSDEYRDDVRQLARRVLAARLGVPTVDTDLIMTTAVTALKLRAAQCHLCVAATDVAERHEFLVCRVREAARSSTETALSVVGVLLIGFRFPQEDTRYEVVPLTLNLCVACSAARQGAITKELCLEHPLVEPLYRFEGFTEIRWPAELRAEQRADAEPPLVRAGARVLTSAGLGGHPPGDAGREGRDRPRRRWVGRAGSEPDPGRVGRRGARRLTRARGAATASCINHSTHQHRAERDLAGRWITISRSIVAWRQKRHVDDESDTEHCPEFERPGGLDWFSGGRVIPDCCCPDSGACVGRIDWTITASVDCGSGRPANGTPAEPCRNAWQPFH